MRFKPPLCLFDQLVAGLAGLFLKGFDPRLNDPRGILIERHHTLLSSLGSGGSSLSKAPKSNPLRSRLTFPSRIAFNDATGKSKVTEEELERLLIVSHDGMRWFAKALQRQRPQMKWSV